MQKLIKNGQVFSQSGLQPADILIKDGKIEKIAPKINEKPNFQIINASGLTAIPGLCDVHVHFRDPGFTQKETIKTGSTAAAHGGFTSVCAMPNVSPVPNNSGLLKEMIKKNREVGVVNIFQYAPVTINQNSDELVDFVGLKQAGAVAFSNDGNGIQNSRTMLNAMIEVQKVNSIIAAHLQDDSLMDNGVINKGKASKRLDLPGISQLAETTQLVRDLELARQTGVHYHVCHVSCKRSVDLIRKAKKDGVNVTCEVTPHHLLLNESNILNDNPAFKMNPPLRKSQDQEALLEGLKDGTIDMIATDHAPHTKFDKGNSFKNGAFGIIGLETAFPLLFTNLVLKGKCSLSDLIKWMAINPNIIFGLNQSEEIRVGNKGNFCLWNLHKDRKISVSNFESRGTNSPFIGNEVTGENQMTFVDGYTVWEND